jgi:hypothetical protein
MLSLFSQMLHNISCFYIHPDLILIPNNWCVSKMETGTLDSLFSLYPTNSATLEFDRNCLFMQK